MDPDSWKTDRKSAHKEFSLKKANQTGKSSGFNVKLTQGDVDWPAVVRALKDIGYNGWTILEQSGGNSPEGLKDLNGRLDKIISL
jgi:hexulose-6-phosphate isomerase